MTAWRTAGLVPGIAPSGYHPAAPPRVHPLHPGYTVCMKSVPYTKVKLVVGL